MHINNIYIYLVSLQRKTNSLIFHKDKKISKKKIELSAIKRAKTQQKTLAQRKNCYKLYQNWHISTKKKLFLKDFPLKSFPKCCSIIVTHRVSEKSIQAKKEWRLKFRQNRFLILQPQKRTNLKLCFNKFWAPGSTSPNHQWSSCQKTI